MHWRDQIREQQKEHRLNSALALYTLHDYVWAHPTEVLRPFRFAGIKGVKSTRAAKNFRYMRLNDSQTREYINKVLKRRNVIVRSKTLDELAKVGFVDALPTNVARARQNTFKRKQVGILSFEDAVKLPRQAVAAKVDRASSWTQSHLVGGREAKR